MYNENMYRYKYICMVIEWPVNSPDINPIENLWAIIKPRLKKEDCSTMQKMISAVIKVS